MYLFLYEESRAHVLFMVKVVYPMCPMGSKSPQGGLVSRRGTRPLRRYHARGRFPAVSSYLE